MADVAIVGSSPRLLLEAAAEARAGNDVVLLTNREPFGGAWWVDDVAGFSDVETACHLLEAEPVGYDVLRSVPGLELAPMHPLPKVHAGRLSLTYGSPAAVAAIAAIGVPAVGRAGWRESRATDWRAGIDAARKSAAVRVDQARNDLGARGQDILYPVGGAGTLLRQLRDLVVSEGVTLDDRHVSSIDTSSESGVRLLVEDDDMHAGRVVVSAGYSGSIVNGAASTLSTLSTLSTAGEPRTHEHVLLVAPSGAVRPLSYDRFMTDPVLLRASDVTASANSPEPGGRALLMIGTRHRIDESDAKEVLLRQGVLTESVEFDEVVHYTHTSRNRAVALAEAAVGSPVEVLSTFGDLSRSLRDFARRHPSWLRSGHVGE